MAGRKTSIIAFVLFLAATMAGAGCIQPTEPDSDPPYPEPHRTDGESRYATDGVPWPPSSLISADADVQGLLPDTDPQAPGPDDTHLGHNTTHGNTEAPTDQERIAPTPDTRHERPGERNCTERPTAYPTPRPPTLSPTQFHSPDGPRLHHELNDTHYRTVILPRSATLCLDHVRIAWGGTGGGFEINGIDLINGTRVYYCERWYDSPNHCGANTQPYPLNATGYRLVVSDRDSDGRFGPGDGVVATYDGNTTTNTFDDPLPRGPHSIQIDHTSFTAYRDWNGHDWLPQPYLRITSEPDDTAWNLTALNELGTDRHIPWAATLTIHYTTKLHMDLTTIDRPERGVFYAPYPNNTTGEHPGPTYPTYPTPPATGPALRVSFHDTDADGHWTIDDHILVQYDNGTSPDADRPRTWHDPFPENTYFMRVHGANDTTLGWSYGIVYPPGFT